MHRVPPCQYLEIAVWKRTGTHSEQHDGGWGMGEGGCGGGGDMVMHWLPEKQRKETVCDSGTLQPRNDEAKEKKIEAGAGTSEAGGEAQTLVAVMMDEALTLNSNKRRRDRNTSRQGKRYVARRQ